MKTLHLDLKPVADNYVELRYFWDNPNQYEKRSLPLGEIADLIQLAEQDYYVRLAVNYTITGRKLYNWLDGSDRLLQQAIDRYWREGIVLAIKAAEKLAHLPWELLHDGKGFLLERLPGVVPVRWVASDTGKKLSVEAKPENRALNVLFMATSPLGVEPVLEFEREEALILEATARKPLSLTVEESGCLTELGYLAEDRGKGFFDILHLTGHATITEEGARFYTETETGELYLASARDIATELQFQLPKLIFLSGCRTGQAGDAGAVPSMAEELLQAGANLVLGWGQPVLDTDARAAAAALYKGLAAGKSVTEAVALTYQKLIENKARDWHLLRLYVAETLPGGLVTPLLTLGRKPAPKPSVAERFLDPAGKVKVPTRGSFIGRRRQLQNCLRALKNPPSPPYQGGNIEGVGVLIHGMGGLGKSSLAARLCDRLPEFERIVWVGRVDEPSLVNKLAAALDSRELREALQDDKEELKFRLRRVFRQLEDGAAKPFLLVLDDFEANLEPRDGGYVLQPEAARVLEALVWAIEDTSAPHRLILTCRYDFESTLLQDFYKQPMEGLRGADLRKKCSRLSAFDAKSQVDEALQSQATRLADGNPRLLEWLDKVLLNLEPPPVPLDKGEARDFSPLDKGEARDFSPLDKGGWGGSQQGEKKTVAEILQGLETNPVELREKVLAKALLEQIDPTLEEILRRGLVFELPVPREAIAAVCEETPNLERQINRAVALGLLEVSPDQSLRVPRILEKNLTPQPPSLRGKGESDSSFSPLLAGEGLGERLHQQAAEVLYRLWWEEAETSTEEQRLEIHRLALRGKVETIAVEIADTLAWRWVNQSRFREAVELCQATLEIAEDYRVLHGLARSEKELGEVSQAQTHYQQALDSCPQDDEKEKSAIIHNLAILKANSGEIEEAIALYQQSLEIKERIGDAQGKAATLHCLAILKANTGEIEEAIALYQQSLDIEEGIGNAQGKAATLHQLAILKANTGEIEEAIALYQQSLEIKERIGDAQGKAATLHCLAILKANTGEIEEAIALYQQSLDIEEGIGNAQGKAATLHQLASLKANTGEIEQAIALYQQSLEITERIGNAQTKAATLHQLARLKANTGEIEEAIALYQQSLEITERIGNAQGKAATLHCLASLKANTGQIEEAIALYQQSLEITERIGNAQTKAATLHQLARLKANTGEIEEAIALYQQSLEITERIGNAQGKAATLAMLGQLLADEKGDFNTGLNYLQQSLEILQRLQSPGAETVRQIIARVQQMRDDIS
ncbi:tetratricopeptide repeat protein [Allocoleopsis franciscana]|uniref:NB-ARC domain-containing protein n=1 Tax=Allocoleopsis franciscana PCC 7113 TaxID=1173027 RepID=K9WE46_9CYAN|nr:tetratricopeptide repeat protein [Allocoleopsis franciscana]AFZ17807.1 NB-ARC domain-containing protein [Allocoleopsis franciscana PCC 7113]